jgi:hypothetical protein
MKRALEDDSAVGHHRGAELVLVGTGAQTPQADGLAGARGFELRGVTRGAPPAYGVSACLADDDQLVEALHD